MKVGQLLMTRDGPGDAVREAQVVAVLGVNAGPPFLVRWLDTGRTSRLYPDGDVWTERRTHRVVPELRGNRCG